MTIDLPRRELDARPQAARQAVVQAEAPAMGLRDQPRDREAKSKPVRAVHTASRVATDKWLEHLFLVAIGNPGSVVLDVDAQGTVGRAQGHDDFGAEADRIGDQVGYGPRKIVGAKLRGKAVGAL